MTNLVVEVSRYLIILLIAIYTYYNFRFFSMKDQEGRDLACSRQLVCMFMLHFLANMVIVLNTGLESLAFFYGAQVIFLSLIHTWASEAFVSANHWIKWARPSLKNTHPIR